tara:strand:+ start:1132 stop:1326 length:195 start_codon:yes stop_codon:yes gene_type:complete
MKDKKQHCYKSLLGKIDMLDNQICRVKDQLVELRNLILTTEHSTENSSKEDVEHKTDSQNQGDN